MTAGFALTLAILAAAVWLAFFREPRAKAATPGETEYARFCLGLAATPDEPLRKCSSCKHWQAWYIMTALPPEARRAAHHVLEKVDAGECADGQFSHYEKGHTI